MSAPKITHVMLREYGPWNDWACFVDNGTINYATTSELRDYLTQCGQTLDIPDDVQPGWVGIPEDLPRPEPPPERWINVYNFPSYLGWPSRARADAEAAPNRLAVLHVWTDADGVDHAEIERVTP